MGNGRGMHWLWRSLAGIAGGAVLAGSLGNFMVEGLIELLRAYHLTRDAAIAVAIAITAMVFMTIPMAVYGVLGRLFPPLWHAGDETRCRKCGYILKGLTEPRCPECGERI